MSNTLEHYIEQAGNAKDDIGTVIRKWIGPVCYGEWGKRLTFPQQKLYQDGVIKDLNFYIFLHQRLEGPGWLEFFFHYEEISVGLVAALEEYYF